MKLIELPPEIVDKIILYSGFKVAVIIDNIYCIRKLYIPSVHTWKWASKNNELDIVKWLYKNEITGRDYYAMDLAAKHGHLEIIKYLHTHKNKIIYVPYKYEYDFEYYKKYIEPHLLEATNGCTENAMQWAAQNGHLEVVKYLHSIGKKISIMSLFLADKYNHTEIVKFLKNLYKSKNHLDILKQCHQYL